MPDDKIVTIERKYTNEKDEKKKLNNEEKKKNLSH